MTFAPHTLDPELDLELDRETDVAPELVWRAWTEPELLKQWFTPRPWDDAGGRGRPASRWQVPHGDAFARG